jgi:hypothetical protein
MKQRGASKTISRSPSDLIVGIVIYNLLDPAVAVEGAVARPPSAQIPACGITALGSSDSLASAARHKI